MKTWSISLFLILFALITNGETTQQKSKKQLKAEEKAWTTEQIKAIVRSKSFIFKAETVNPLSQPVKKLTTEFGIEVKNDSVFSYMPYFGKSYSKDYTSQKDSPMGFIQPITDYQSDKLKKEYRVRIKVKNEHDVVDLTFHIAFNGNTSVTASSINRQTIAYDGFIIIPMPEEPKK